MKEAQVFLVFYLFQRLLKLFGSFFLLKKKKDFDIFWVFLVCYFLGSFIGSFFLFGLIFFLLAVCFDVAQKLPKTAELVGRYSKPVAYIYIYNHLLSYILYIIVQLV